MKLNSGGHSSICATISLISLLATCSQPPPLRHLLPRDAQDVGKLASHSGVPSLRALIEVTFQEFFLFSAQGVALAKLGLVPINGHLELGLVTPNRVSLQP